MAVHCPTDDPPPDDQPGWAGDGKISALAIETAGNSHEFRLDLRRVVLTRITDDGQALQIGWWQPGSGLRQSIRR